MPRHPTPWRVAYDQRFPEWDAKASPRVVDANGGLVAEIPQHVDHPGEYDIEADRLAQRIVAAVNAKNLH